MIQSGGKTRRVEQAVCRSVTAELDVNRIHARSADLRSDLLEETRIYCVLARLHHADLPGVLVPWVQQNIERFRHHCGEHSQQRGTPRLKPAISDRTREIGSFEPVRRKICRRHVFDD